MIAILYTHGKIHAGVDVLRGTDGLQAGLSVLCGLTIRNTSDWVDLAFIRDRGELLRYVDCKSCHRSLSRL